MDDTKVDWTKRIDMPAPAPAPADASHAGTAQPGSGPSGEDRVAQLERSCRRMRVVMGVLAGVVVVLAAATIAMGVVLFSKIDEQGGVRSRRSSKHRRAQTNRMLPLLRTSRNHRTGTASLGLSALGPKAALTAAPRLAR